MMLYDIKCIILALNLYRGATEVARVYRSRSCASYYVYFEAISYGNTFIKFDRN